MDYVAHSVPEHVDTIEIGSRIARLINCRRKKEQTANYRKTETLTTKEAIKQIWNPEQLIDLMSSFPEPVYDQGVDLFGCLKDRLQIVLQLVNDVEDLYEISLKALVNSCAWKIVRRRIAEVVGINISQFTSRSQRISYLATLPVDLAATIIV